MADKLTDCPCTTIEQDEDCPVGYPSLLCGACKGTGRTQESTVTALAAEMLRIASDMGEPEDPFAAWETIDLIKSQNDQLRKALEPFAKYAGDPSHIKQRAFLQVLICPLGDDHPDNHIPHFQAARAALAATAAKGTPAGRAALEERE